MPQDKTTYQRVVELTRADMDVATIAERLGIRNDSVNACLAVAKSRGHLGGARVVGASGVTNKFTTVPMAPDLWQGYVARAETMGVNHAQLMQAVLEVAMRDGIVDAVLDSG